MELNANSLTYCDQGGCQQKITGCFEYAVTGGNVDVYQGVDIIHLDYTEQIDPLTGEPFGSLEEMTAFLDSAISALCHGIIIEPEPVDPEPEPEYLYDDVGYDLAPTSGADECLGSTGQNYEIDDIKQHLVNAGVKYSDGSLFALTDQITKVEVDLKGEGGHGVHEGKKANGKSTATTCQAAYKNNGMWSDIDPGGGRVDGQIQTLPSSFECLFIENGSIGTLHVEFCKEV